MVDCAAHGCRNRPAHACDERAAEAVVAGSCARRRCTADRPRLCVVRSRARSQILPMREGVTSPSRRRRPVLPHSVLNMRFSGSTKVCARWRTSRQPQRRSSASLTSISRQLGTPKSSLAITPESIRQRYPEASLGVLATSLIYSEARELKINDDSAPWRLWATRPGADLWKRSDVQAA